MKDYVWVVSAGTLYEGGRVVAVTQSSIEAGIIAKFERKSEYYSNSCDFVKIEKWIIGQIDQVPDELKKLNGMSALARK